MLFIYTNSSKKIKTKIKLNDKKLQLLVTEEETGKNITYDIGSTDDEQIIEKLTNRFGEGIELEDNPSRQFVKLDDGFVGYTQNDNDEIVMVEAHQLNHKPSSEERAKIVPRNIIVVITDEDTTVWTHKNNVHQNVKISKSTIGGLLFTKVVPKWNNWKVLKFPASILIENEAKDIKEKIILTFSVHTRKDTSKYHMNNIKVTEWGEKDKIFKPRNKDGFYKDRNTSRRQRPSRNDR